MPALIIDAIGKFGQVTPKKILACIHWPDVSILDFYSDWLLLARVGLLIVNRRSAGVWLGAEYLIHPLSKKAFTYQRPRTPHAEPVCWRALQVPRRTRT